MKTSYHTLTFPFDFIYKEWLPLVYGGGDIELCMENEKGEWWRNTKLTGTYQDFIHKVRSWGTVKLHTGASLPNCKTKPLIFDLDLDREHVNRDGICNCDRQVCSKCWFFMEAATRIFQYLLPRVFNVDQGSIKTLFSGGRGLHIWVKGKTFTQQEREVIVERLMAFSNPDAYWHPVSSQHMEEHILRPIWEKHLEGNPNRKALFERLFPYIDAGPTLDAKHAVGCPLSIHHRTGYVIQPLWKRKDHFEPIHYTDVTPAIMHRWQAYLLS